MIWEFSPSLPPSSTVWVAHDMASSEEGRCGGGDRARGLVNLVSVVVHDIRRKKRWWGWGTRLGRMGKRKGKNYGGSHVFSYTYTLFLLAIG